MLGDCEYKVTEWEWLRVNLQLYSLSLTGTLYRVFFDFEDKPRRIICSIYADYVQTMVDEGHDREEQFEYYQGWIASERQRIQDIVVTLPRISQQIRWHQDVVFRVLYNYETGARVVCQVIGEEVEWSGKA